jgi:alpha-L-fucosidase
VAVYLGAARAEGLRVGLYYSLMDWHHPDGARCKHDEAARRRFVDYTHGLVRELCTSYGRLDILWFDVNWPLSAQEWEADRLVRMVRRLQPGIIINDRTGLPEDFGTPENEIEPAERGRMWEACMTFGDESFGYAPIDKRYKDAWTVVSMLRQVAAGGGNLLLNIGPAPDGSVPGPCERVLLKVGEWLRRYGPTIYDAGDPMRQDWMLTGAFTRKGDAAYFHCSRWPGSELAIGGLKNRVLEARLFGGKPVRFTQTGDRLVLHGLPEKAPDPLATVIELKVEGVPSQVLGMGCVLIDDDPMHYKS